MTGERVRSHPTISVLIVGFMGGGVNLKRNTARQQQQLCSVGARLHELLSAPARQQSCDYQSEN